MNNHEPYERSLDRTLPDPVTAPRADHGVDELAVHRDPSLPQARAPQESESARPTVAWVRPSEMPTQLGASWVRRGIDLQAELTRRARRTPGVVASKATRRLTRTPIARTESPIPTTTQEGLGL